MSRILISFFSNMTWLSPIKPDSFVESFSNVLKRNGNDVLSITTNYFKDEKKVFKYINTNKVIDEVKKFNPDLIIAFNNSLPSVKILEHTTCPIVLFAADSPSFFENKDIINKYIDRYFFVNSSTDTLNAINEWFQNIKSERNLLFGHASDFRAKEMEKDINISFVGSIGNWNQTIPFYFKQLYEINKYNKKYDINEIKNEFFNKFNEFQKNPTLHLNYNLPDYKFQNDFERWLILAITSNKRFEILSQLTDLGLKIYSYPQSMPDLLLFNYKLFEAFDYTTCTTFNDITNIYNRSKISINLPHGQAINGFSWRVCDICASNAALLMNNQSDIKKMMKPYIDYPTYENKFEAYNLAKKMLNDESYRKDLVMASNKMVEECCRFEPKFKLLEEILNLKLISNTQGTFKTLEIESVVKPIQYWYYLNRKNRKEKRLYNKILNNHFTLK